MDRPSRVKRFVCLRTDYVVFAMKFKLRAMNFKLSAQ